MITRSRAALAVMGAAALFGTTGTSRQLLVPDAPGTGIAAMRLIVGSLGLIVYVLWRGRGSDLLRLWRRPLVWVMGLSVAGYQAFFFIGTQRTGVAIAALMALGVAPFLAGLLGWAMREGAPGWLWAASTAVAVIGMTLLVAGNLSSGDGWGMLSAVAAGGCYAIYTVFGVRLSRDGFAGSDVLAASFAIGAVTLIPAAVSSLWWWSVPGVIEVIWLGLFTTTLGYLLFGVGLAVLQPGHIATLTLLEPAVATMLGVLVLHEPISALGWVGCVLIFGALALLGLGERSSDHEHDDQDETKVTA